MRKKAPDWVPCTIRQLPHEERHAAARRAIAIHPANRADVEALARAGVELTAEFIAVLTTKYWGPDGVHLTVGFLEPMMAALADKILAHMNAWAAYCNAKFTLSTSSPANAQVRISLAQPGYWSYLGVDVLAIPKGQPTMNLQGFTLNTPDSEYARVIRHETGHTLGCPHEHSRRSIVAKLDAAKTIDYFQRTQGWSAQAIRQQILTPIEETALMGTPTAEEDSIMAYGFPGSITLDGRPIAGGTNITADDGAFLGKLYPTALLPPPPPPPPPSGGPVTIPSAGQYKAATVNGKTALVLN